MAAISDLFGDGDFDGDRDFGLTGVAAFGDADDAAAGAAVDAAVALEGDGDSNCTSFPVGGLLGPAPIVFALYFCFDLVFVLF